jgi:hypothetical protein
LSQKVYVDVHVSGCTLTGVRVTSQRTVVIALVAALSTLGMGATPAQAASVGYIRLAHLSPDTAPVDVYLDSLSGTVPQQVFRGVGYGVMSQYLKLPVGGYSVSMRKTNSVPSDPILLTTSVNVTSNSAYTIAGVGKNVDIGLRVLKDDLKLPTGNKSKVRIIQASLQLPVINVSVSGGAIIANNVAFATTTGYQLVSPGQWQLQITPAGGGNTTDLSADLGSGSVYSLLVLDGGNGTVKAELRTDASRQGGLPNGGINTGGGGAQEDPTWPIAAAAVVLVAVTAGIFVAMRLRRRKTVL